MPVLTVTANFALAQELLLRLTRLAADALDAATSRVMLVALHAQLVLDGSQERAALIELRSAREVTLERARVFVDAVAKDLADTQGVLQSRVYVSLTQIPEASLYRLVNGHAQHAGESLRLPLKQHTPPPEERTP